MRQSRNAGLLLCGMAGTLLLCGCGWDGNFTVLGYTTAPNYDCSIQTVYVPIFQNVTFRQGLEFDLTKAVIREIEAKTPFRVVSSREEADTELLGKLVNWNKQVLNVNQLNEVREAQTTLTVEVVWRDLRPGRVGETLSQPLPVPGAPPPLPGAPPPVVLVQSLGTFIPELGGSRATAEKEAVDRLATQIISMMEQPW